MPKRGKGKILRGEIIAHNFDPSGAIEGVVLDAEGTHVQANFPKRRDPALCATLQVGETAELWVDPHDSAGDHPVFVISGTVVRVEGTVARLNYTPDGEVNGYQLERGLLVYMGARAARRLGLHIGDRIIATGMLRAGSHTPVLDGSSIELVAPAQRAGSS